MSVNKVDKITGGLTVLAGKNVSTMVPSAGLMQSGSLTASSVGTGTYVNEQITFATPMPDVNYVISFDAIAVGGIVFTVMAKTVNYFSVNIWNLNSITVDVPFKWTAVRLVTDQTTELDEEAITKRIAFPDYAHPLTMTSKTWTATQDVFISAFQMTGTSDIQVVTINGERCAADPDSANNVYTYTCNAFAKKGDVISYALLDSPYRCKVFPLLT